MSAEPKVSVHMPAYNHGPYIAQALDSVLMQKVDFEYEIVVGEDCSTDDTRAVATEYARRHPDRIKVLLHERNLGIYDNDQSILRACRGKYIAWLESDDYWTSPDKLRLQVEMMEGRPELAACFHVAGIAGDGVPPVTWRPGPSRPKPSYTLDDLLEEGHFVPSCTAVFRSELARPAWEWTRGTPFLETTYFARFATRGSLGYIDREMAVFRCRAGGVYGSAGAVGNLQAAIRAHRLVGRHLQVSGRPSYRRGLASMYRRLGREYEREGRRWKALGARVQAAWAGRGADGG